MMNDKEYEKTAVDEMNEISDGLISKHFDETGENGISSREVHKAFAAAGFRKEKETAKRIYKALLGTEHIKELVKKDNCEFLVSRWRLEDINRVFKEYGVEVENDKQGTAKKA